MTKPNKKLITALKFIISGLLIYFIFTKISLEEVLQTLKKTQPLFLFLALVFFIASKVVASFRVNLYFGQLHIFLTQWSNLKLYVLGMFYNLFLPGGIGGDAYKGYVIKKEFDVPTKKIVSALVLDRLSGLLLLFIYACILVSFLNLKIVFPIAYLAATLIILSIILFWAIHQKFFRYVVPIFWKTFGYSALVQLFQLASAYFILKALQIEFDTSAYLFIFLVSSIVSVIPLTIGGIGSRELTFFYGATLLHLDENTSIGVSMVFFLITALVSFVGVFYHFKKPKLELKQ
ncbi:lysylphosphatidylglycerol synthase transmembrane domain-containing protein [Cellulophaga sp. Hel_I_12]|uniref:lysylphosphatidylglycerol synthase transmembrane domain-containing protein n=1 Tax=Cellulophaga sp. Hel_I_12 TaxID=1249972 RepID=UPI00064757BD|nr:lysylphosphatidylglycerol synthase transmembrane domain-containing protein [Cellulophaga sp. Hel_I_12]